MLRLDLTELEGRAVLDLLLHATLELDNNELHRTFGWGYLQRAARDRALRKIDDALVAASEGSEEGR